MKSLFDIFKRAAQLGDGVPARGTHVSPELVGRLPLNKWVVVRERVGILHKYDTLGQAEVHYVNPETGETDIVILVRVPEMRIARFQEIPEIRRIGLTPAAAAVLGYC
jgi:hypothetical protein